MEKLKELGLDDKYGALYDAKIVHKKEINSARNEGYSDGKKEGRKEDKKETARNLLKDNMSINAVAKYTGLSRKEIEHLV